MPTTLKLIIIAGLPGTGKSTLAENLAKKFSCFLLSVDPIESAIIRSGFHRNFKTGLAAYLIAEQLAAENLKLGITVIIDAVSPVKEARSMWNNLAAKYNAKLIIIECILDQSIHKARISTRIRNLPGIPEVTWNDVEKRRKEYLPWDQQRLIINSSNSIRKNIAQTVIYINSQEK